LGKSIVAEVKWIALEGGINPTTYIHERPAASAPMHHAPSIRVADYLTDQRWMIVHKGEIVAFGDGTLIPE